MKKALKVLLVFALISASYFIALANGMGVNEKFLECESEENGNRFILRFEQFSSLVFYVQDFDGYLHVSGVPTVAWYKIREDAGGSIFRVLDPINLDWVGDYKVAEDKLYIDDRRVLSGFCKPYSPALL